AGRRRGGLVEQRMGAEERPNEQLDAAAAEARLEEAVDRMVARIRLVTREIERTIDGEWQGGVDLNAAREMTLVARERAPPQVRHVFDVDALGGPHAPVPPCPVPRGRE